MLYNMCKVKVLKLNVVGCDKLILLVDSKWFVKLYLYIYSIYII